MPVDPDKKKLEEDKMRAEFDANENIRKRRDSFADVIPTPQENFQKKIYEENLRRLNLLDRYNKKPRTAKEEEEERIKLIDFTLSGGSGGSFIAFEDLENLASKGKKFFIPPADAKGVACLSCGNGCFYKGTLSEIHKQLQSDLKNDPENQQLNTGLKRISDEIMAKPHLLSPKNTPVHSEEQGTSQRDTYTSPNPFSIKPKISK